MTTKDAEGNNLAIVAPVVLTFEITDTKLYVPVVTLSKENDIKLLEQLKTGFKKNYKMEQIQIATVCSTSKKQLELFN